MLYADIAVNRPLHSTFTYHLPDDLIAVLQPGHLVEVSFATARMSGIVLAIHEQKPDFQTKPVLQLLDSVPMLTALQLHSGQWLARNTLTPIGHALWLMLPSGIAGYSTTLYALKKYPEDTASLSPTQKRIVNLLQQRGALTTTQLKRALPHSSWEAAISILVKGGIVGSHPTLRPPAIKPKTVQTAHLLISPVEIPAIAPHLGRESKRAAVLEILLEAPHYCLTLQEIMDIAGCSESPVKTLEKSKVVSIDRHQQVILNIPPETVHKEIIHLRDAQIYLDILFFLAAAGQSIAVSTIYQETGATLKHLYALESDGLIALSEEEIWRDPLAERHFVPSTAPELTHPQAEAWHHIRSHMDIVRQDKPAGSHVFLLHGITGSGKTEVYMQAVAYALQQGRQAIVLVPEIALTAQLVQRFMARFPVQHISLIHSRLSAGERYDTWRRARQGDLDILLGARSALFAPLPDVGLIVLDEEHDDSYKQDSSAFIHQTYHAREVAIEMMRQNHGTVILGSATPDLNTMFRAQRGEFCLLTLPNRVLAHKQEIAKQEHDLHVHTMRYQEDETPEVVSAGLPPVQIVDMRQELRAGHRSIFSRVLLAELHRILQAGEQAILFLNRRGSATFVMCRDCGNILNCPRCEMPLTYHQRQEKLICHYCGHREPNPAACPQCNSTRIKYFGAGTEKLDQTLNEEFPTARILRWDYDTARERGAHERILQQFTERQADILVGTQMIAKGLDIPLVTLVGIISGDTALGLPDYRASERTFQLLTQVAGRAGRGLLGGKVILQTYQPDHYAIIAAAEHDYRRFYDQELRYRRQLNYPPYTRLARIVFTDTNPTQAERHATQLAQALRRHQKESHFTATEIVGPTPCFFMRLDNEFRWQLIIRSTDPVAFLQGIDLGGGILDIDPVDLL